MGKFQFGLDLCMGIIAIATLGYIKISGYKLRKTYKHIKLKKKLVSKILYLVAIWLIFVSTYKLANNIGDNSYNIYSCVGHLSRIFIGVMGIYFFSEKVKVMDKGIVYKYHILKKEELLGFKLVGDSIEIKYGSYNSCNTLKIKSEKENDKEIVKELKNHFNIW